MNSLFIKKMAAIIHHLKHQKILSSYSIYFLLGGFILVLILKDKQSSSAPQNFQESNRGSQQASPSADTYIPEGHVLVPIEVTNAAGIQSLIGEIGGTVDLFSTSQDNRKGKLIGKRLRLLRAPLDPEQFAVLVHEDSAKDILAYSGAYYVVIHNPKAKSGAIETKQKKPFLPTIEVEYQETL